MDPHLVIHSYIDHVLEHGHSPVSVYAFAKDREFTEREFFEQFSTFEALESGIWKKTVTDTIEAVQSSDEWNGFSAQQRLLTFYYAYCDRILDQRSFFLVRFPRIRDKQLPSPALRGMRDAFTSFAESIVQTGMERGEVACRGPLSRTYPQGLFGHFLTVVEFNLADTSQRFERTDAYIEKSVRLAFDVIGTQALDSAFDLVRFLSGRSWGTPPTTTPDV